MSIDRDESLPSTIPVSQSDDSSEEVRALQRQNAFRFLGRYPTAPATATPREISTRDLLRKSR
jgi:hypothetical protein